MKSSMAMLVTNTNNIMLTYHANEDVVQAAITVGIPIKNIFAMFNQLPLQSICSLETVVKSLFLLQTRRYQILKQQHGKQQVILHKLLYLILKQHKQLLIQLDC